jgi:hypothetical protein
MNLITRRNHVRDKQSSALVIVLAMVTILTLVLVAYLNLMRMDRLATRNYAQGLRAEEMSRGARDFIISQLRAEMAAGTMPLNVGNYFLYTNITSANIQPEGIGTNSAVAALVKISTNGMGLYTAAPAGLSAVNSLSSSTSANGRSINLGRWAKPGFGTLPTAPSWFLISSTGITNAPSAAVEGRFACAIYNLGSCLDVNVAGFPSSLSPAQKKALQGTLAAPDLSAMPGLSQTTVDALIQNFRNRTSAATPDAYTNQVLNVNATNGFMSVSAGDDTFLSRQDFLAYAKLNGLSDAATNLTTFTRSLNSPSWAPTTNAGAFTIQTATVSTIYPHGNDSWTSPGVTVTPAAPVNYNYQANATTANPTNPSFLSQPVTAPFNRFDGTLAGVGDPLVTHRFPLQRLSWLTYQGPIANSGGVLSTDPGIQPVITQLNSAGIPSSYLEQGTPANILTCFGLVWDSVNKLWVYTSPSSSDGGGTYNGSGSSDGPASSGLAANTVKTLSVVASENREPDFFELLRAGILQGSLGIRSSINMPTYTVQPNEITPDGQAIQIGANIIDQYDTDDYPTLIRAYMPFVMRQDDQDTLRYSYGKGTAALVPYDFAGVENLPYLSQFRYRLYRPQIDQGNPAGRPNVQASLVPQFWNPHQNAATPSAIRPADFRIIQTFGSIRAWLKPAIVTAGVTSYPEELNCETSPPSEWPSSLTPPAPQPMIEFSGTLTFSSPAFLKPSDVIPTNPPEPENIRPAITEAVPPNAPPNPPDPAGFVGFWLGEASGLGNTPYDKNVWAANQGPTPYPFDPSQTLTQIGLLTSLGLPLPATDRFWKGDTASSSTDNQRWPVFELQYLDGTIWKTYQRFDGLFALDQETHDYETAYSSLSDEYDSFVLGRLDPRGNRLGVMQISNVNSDVGWTGPPSIYYNTTLANSFGGQWVAGDAELGTENDPGGDSFDPGNQSGAQFFTQFDPTEAGLLFSYWQVMDNVASGQYFTDNDHVLRRGDGNSAAGVNPLTAAGAQPVMLNRPFTSVGDLGYAYRDLPFKTLDLFSANSADGALLDLFCLSESPVVVAGKVDLNGSNPAVMTLLLTGGTTIETSGTTLSSSDATNIATALVGFSQTNAFTGLWDLPGFLSSTAYTDAVSGSLQNTKTQMEVVPRQLAAFTDTRCWNLLLDVITQSGHYLTGATDPDQFVVQGERRYWLHLAIDRRTGKIVEQQLEPVFE